MNKALIYALKGMRRVYGIMVQQDRNTGRNWHMFSNKQYANELIYKYLVDDKPCMITRFGSTELDCIINHMGVNEQHTKWIDFIKGKSKPWWWDQSTIKPMGAYSGFFPLQTNKLAQFSELMLKETKQVDILGSWLNKEIHLSSLLVGIKQVVLEDLEPFFTPNPWTRVLEGKKILVVHPFADTIEKQYIKRHLLFDNNLLPDFELKTLKSVQSAGFEETTFSDWFEALAYMKNQIDAIDYDICIIGCGAYGFPLAAHVKRMGKKAVHLGGVTQLLFGIRGKRWEQYIVWPYTNLFNDHWVRPSVEEKPKKANVIDGATYW